MLALEAASLGCSAMMLKLLSVSTSRPGEVPAAAIYQRQCLKAIVVGEKS